MAVISSQIELMTQGNTDVLDITEQISKTIEKSALQDGIVVIFSPSSTSAITTIEFESGAISDLKRTFDELVDPKRSYAHNARWGDGNGYSHIRSALLGPSLTVPFSNRRMTLGTWQQIIFVDFDNRPRRRIVQVQIIGE